jgi:integrase
MGGERMYKGVRAVSSTSIEITFNYPNKGERQRERIQLVPTAANLKRAFVHLENINESIRLGTFDYAKTFPNSPRANQFQNRRLLKTYMRHWLEDHKFDYEPATYITYKRIIDNQLKSIGGMRMEAITWGDISNWVRLQKITQKTANNKLSPIRMAFAHAIDQGEIHNNPFANKASPKIKRHKQVDIDEEDTEVVDPFSRDEIIAIIGNAKYQRDVNMISFGFGTGVRISELIALTWKQIDFINRTVLIDRKKTIHSKTATKPKTKSSRRVIKLKKMAWDAIMSQKQHTFLEGKEVFMNPRTDAPFTGDSAVRTPWTTILKKAGVRYRGPGQMRHTWASTSLQLGENMYYVSANMGHTKASFTMDVYNKYIPDNHPDAGSKFDEFFGSEEEANAGKMLAK